WMDLPLSFSQVALGAEVSIPTLDGNVNYTIKEGTQPGDVLTLKGKGFPYLRGRGSGDQLVRVASANRKVRRTKTARPKEARPKRKKRTRPTVRRRAPRFRPTQARALKTSKPPRNRPRAPSAFPVPSFP
ncbi:MAG: hypothetical protein IJO46_01140, partial [Thermoguttaceae bacterium]|nr:hypothetical protein [Thermoguttaceae bacterium]